MKIVLCKAKDLKNISAIEIELYPNNAYSYEFLEKIYKSDNFYMYKLVNNISLRSYCILLKSGDDLEILKLSTVTKDQNKGYASKILHFVIDNLEYEQIFLEVNPDNTRALKLYEKLGFKKIRVIQNYYGQSDAITMQYSNKSSK